jgi:phosphatidylglycerophosphate synthase
MIQVRGDVRQVAYRRDAAVVSQNPFQIQEAEKPRFDRFFEERICRPIALCLPRALRPNTISVVNHLVMWLTVLLLGVAASFEGGVTMTILCLGSMGFVTSAILDNLDGMHARGTGQCSKLGVLLDHGLDAPNVILNAAGIILMLQLESTVAAAGLLSSAFIYHAQVVHDHHTGQWVPPPASGAAGQVACTFTVLIWGSVFLVFGRFTSTVDFSVNVFGWAVVALNCRQWSFYLRRLKWLALHHLNLIVVGGAYAVFYLTGVLDLVALLALLAGLAYRLTGTTVLRTLRGERYHGWDPSVLAWLALITGLAFLHPIELGGTTVQLLAPYLATVHVCVLNLIDIRQALREDQWAVAT